MVVFQSHMLHAGGGLPAGQRDGVTVFMSFSSKIVDYHIGLVLFLLLVPKHYERVKEVDV